MPSIGNVATKTDKNVAETPKKEQQFVDEVMCVRV
jgi:hypothetical protein